MKRQAGLTTNQCRLFMLLVEAQLRAEADDEDLYDRVCCALDRFDVLHNDVALRFVDEIEDLKRTLEAEGVLK